MCVRLGWMFQYQFRCRCFRLPVLGRRFLARWTSTVVRVSTSSLRRRPCRSCGAVRMLFPRLQPPRCQSCSEPVLLARSPCLSTSDIKISFPMSMLSSSAKTENRLRFGKVTESLKVGTFLRHSVDRRRIRQWQATTGATVTKQWRLQLIVQYRIVNKGCVAFCTCNWPRIDRCRCRWVVEIVFTTIVPAHSWAGDRQGKCQNTVGSEYPKGPVNRIIEICSHIISPIIV